MSGGAVRLTRPGRRTAVGGAVLGLLLAAAPAAAAGRTADAEPAASGRQPARPPQVVTWSIGAPEPGPRAGEVAVPLTARLRAGWKLYSWSQPSEGPVPLSIAVAGGPFEIRGISAEPEALEEHDRLWDALVRWHTRDTTFHLTLRATEPIGGRTPLALRVRYQACTDELCLRPLTITLDTVVEPE